MQYNMVVFPELDGPTNNKLILSNDINEVIISYNSFLRKASFK